MVERILDIKGGGVGGDSANFLFSSSVQKVITTESVIIVVKPSEKICYFPIAPRDKMII